MSKPRSAERASAAASLEHPASGGSYVRNADGSLTRVEGPDDEDAEPAETEPAYAGANAVNDMPTADAAGEES